MEIGFNQAWNPSKVGVPMKGIIRVTAARVALRQSTDFESRVDKATESRLQDQPPATVNVQEEDEALGPPNYDDRPQSQKQIH
jgi:hypothetical protein